MQTVFTDAKNTGAARHACSIFFSLQNKNARRRRRRPPTGPQGRIFRRKRISSAQKNKVRRGGLLLRHFIARRTLKEETRHILRSGRRDPAGEHHFRVTFETRWFPLFRRRNRLFSNRVFAVDAQWGSVSAIFFLRAHARSLLFLCRHQN